MKSSGSSMRANWSSTALIGSFFESWNMLACCMHARVVCYGRGTFLAVEDRAGTMVAGHDSLSEGETIDAYRQPDPKRGGATGLPSLACASCTDEFVVTTAEQRFRRDNNLPIPHLCPACRSAQRSARNGDLLAAHEHDAPERGQHRGGRGTRTSQHRNMRRGPVTQSHPAICAACRAETHVPFAPRPDRPVYCRDCFNARQGR